MWSRREPPRMPEPGALFRSPEYLQFGVASRPSVGELIEVFSRLGGSSGRPATCRW